MKRFVPRVLPYHHSKTSGWCIETRVNGKRVRKFFATRPEADKELKRITTKIRREGEEALELSDDLRIAALTIQRQLEPFGKTLRDAGAHYLKFLEDSQRSITVSDLTDEYLTVKQRLGLSAVHLMDLQHHFKVFCADFGQTQIRTLTPEQIEPWLHDLNLSPQTVNNHRARLSSLLRYAVKKRYLDNNWITEIEAIKLPNNPPEIFKVDELRQLLENASADLLPSLVIGAFAGLRSAELVRLNWSDLNLQRGFIDVPATKAKSARRRLIKMAPNLLAWLAPYANHTGKIWNGSVRLYHHAITQACKASGLSQWPKNGLRHSFASYHLAQHSDAAKLALDMGHINSALIFSNYREIVDPQEAARYWDIFPPSIASNVVSMAG